MKHEENTPTEDDERVVFGGREGDGASIAKGHCLILNKVDTKSLKKYGETTKREPLCEGHRSH